MRRAGAGDGGGGAADWLVVVDPQLVFADPATSPWGSPMWSEVEPRVADLARTAGPERTIVTRFVADPSLGGSWGPYYEEWPFALVPDGDPLYGLVAGVVGVAGRVVTAGTFGKWPVLSDLVRAGDRVRLAGVATDCCVIATALPMADAGVTVEVVAEACAGSTVDNHRQALAAMALFAPQIVVV